MEATSGADKVSIYVVNNQTCRHSLLQRAEWLKVAKDEANSDRSGRDLDSVSTVNHAHDFESPLAIS